MIRNACYIRLRTRMYTFCPWRGAALRQIPCIYSRREIGALYPMGPHPTKVYPTPVLYWSIFFIFPYYTTGDRHCSEKSIIMRINLNMA